MEESFKTEYKASVKIDPTSEPYLEHNTREDNRAKNIYKEMSHQNEGHTFINEINAYINNAEINIDNNTSFKDIHNHLYNTAKDNYLSKPRRSITKFAEQKATLVEAVYELTPETSKEQVIKLTQEIAKLTGFTPLRIDIHKDEGHITENNTFQKHYHAHAVFFTLDETGKQMKRLGTGLTKDNLAKMQDLAVEHLSTDNYKMVRGERRHEHNEEIRKHNKELKEAGCEDPTKYRTDFKNVVYEKDIKVHGKNQAMAQRERQINTKEQDVYNRELIQNQKDLESKELINDFEERLYESEYISALWKKAKGQLTNKELRELAYALTIKERESTEKQLNELKEMYKQEYTELVEQNVFLTEKVEHYEQKRSSEIANYKGIEQEKLNKYISKMNEKEKDLTPTFSQKLKEFNK